MAELVLVRSMKLSLCAILVWAVAGCATQTVIVGRYSANISDADVQQLKVLVRSEREIDHRLAQIDAIAPNRIRIKTGGPNRGGEGSRYVISQAVKRNGRWMFDPHGTGRRRSGGSYSLVTPNRPNQSMKPTAPFRNKFSVLATTPCRGLSLSR